MLLGFALESKRGQPLYSADLSTRERGRGDGIWYVYDDIGVDCDAPFRSCVCS
jgi:hypothetical protein